MINRITTGAIWTTFLIATLRIQNLNHWTDTQVLLGSYFVLALILSYNLYSRPLATTPLDKWPFVVMGAYLGLLGLNPILSQVPFFSTAGAAMCAWLPFSFFSLITLRQSSVHWLRLNLWSLWTPIFALAIFGLHQGLAMNERANGVFPDYSSYAALLYLAAIPIAAFCVAGSANRWQWTALALLAGGIDAANSKGAYLAMTMALTALCFCLRASPGAIKRAAIVVAIFIISYAAVTQSSGVKRDFSDTIHETAPSVEARLWMWSSTLKAYVNEAPFIGTGLYTYKLLYAQYRDPREIYSSGDQAHNDYLQFLLEGGPLLLLGLICVGPGLAGLTFVRATRISAVARTEALGLSAACMALALHAGVNFIYKTPTLMLLAGLYLARSANLIWSSQNEHAATNSARAAWPQPILRLAVPCLALLGTLMLTRDAIIRALVEPPNPALERYFPNHIDEALSALTWIAPDNPYPKNLLVSHLMTTAANESTPEVRSNKLKQAYSVIQEWIDSDRFETGAWLRAGEIAKVDLTVTGQGPSFFLGIASAYRPSNFWIRGQLAQEQKTSQDTKAACDTLRQGTPWVAGTPIFLKRELERWASAGLELCSAFSDATELTFWRSNVKRFADAPQLP